MYIRTVLGDIAPEELGITSGHEHLMGELGTSSPIYLFEEHQLRAAARAQRQTGASINVHPLIWGHEHLHILDILEVE